MVGGIWARGPAMKGRTVKFRNGMRIETYLVIFKHCKNRERYFTLCAVINTASSSWEKGVFFTAGLSWLHHLDRQLFAWRGRPRISLAISAQRHGPYFCRKACLRPPFPILLSISQTPKLPQEWADITKLQPWGTQTWYSRFASKVWAHWYVGLPLSALKVPYPLLLSSHLFFPPIPPSHLSVPRCCPPASPLR